MSESDVRHIRADEAAVISWALLHASLAGALDHLAWTASSLSVSDRCHCGCGSVVFAVERRGGGYRPLADVTGYTLFGEPVSVVVWGTPYFVAALEVVAAPGVPGLPSIGSLRPTVPAQPESLKRAM